MATKVKGGAIKEGSIRLRDLEDNIKSINYDKFKKLIIQKRYTG